MELSEILHHVDHSLLSRTATWEDIREVCLQGLRYGVASVCIPPCYVARVRALFDEMGRELPICTVVGFPNGYATTAAKEAETRDALAQGASEIDMVINVGWVKMGRYDLVEHEIRVLREACRGRILKVIIETCLLTEEEKIKMCRVVTESGADYIKTSTGFSTGGATFADVELFARHIGPRVKIKAAGGIRTLEDAQQYLALGCDRLGTSALVKLAMQADKKE